MRSRFQDLIHSVLYVLESRKGKYSLETYLEIVGEFTDKVILSSQKDGCNYQYGYCTATISDESQQDVIFTVKMIFVDDNGTPMSKEAQKAIPIHRFTKETVDRLKNAKELEFCIEKPEGE